MNPRHQIQIIVIKKKPKTYDSGNLLRRLWRETKYCVKNWQIRKRKKKDKKSLKKIWKKLKLNNKTQLLRKKNPRKKLQRRKSISDRCFSQQSKCVQFKLTKTILNTITKSTKSQSQKQQSRPRQNQLSLSRIISLAFCSECFAALSLILERKRTQKWKALSTAVANQVTRRTDWAEYF